MEARESRARSIAKALTYRVTGTIATIVVTYFVTGEIGAALAVGGIEPFVKIVVYYAHERAWQAVPLGTMRSLAQRVRLVPRTDRT